MFIINYHLACRDILHKIRTVILFCEFDFANSLLVLGGWICWLTGMEEEEEVTAPKREESSQATCHPMGGFFFIPPFPFEVGGGTTIWGGSTILEI